MIEHDQRGEQLKALSLQLATLSHHITEPKEAVTTDVVVIDDDHG